ncbi:Autophagy protein 22 [Podila horticola]|nr:Autophagy protein 22 [Podila horticola]
MARTHKISPHDYSLSELNLTSYEEKQHMLDVVPLKRSEVWAWYIQNATYCGYGWVAGFLMVPLLIQDAASRNGVEASNHALPCDTTVHNFKCVTPVFGHYLDPGTISLYISSISSVLSFFCSLSISAIADHGSYRKSLLIIFSVLGSINALCFFLLQSPKLFWVAAILSPLGWTFFNICGVFTHSYLPIYGRVHPDVLAAEARGESQKTVRKIEEQVVNDLSAYSVGIANVGSVIVHGVCIGISIAMKESMLGLEIAIAFSGVWWIMWMLIVAPWLDARPGSPMPKGKNWVTYSWKKTYNTITSFRQLPEIFKFMIAWFILSDGINTIPAILFVIIYRELSFNHSHSLIISVLLALMACLGAYFFLGIRKLWTLTTKFMIMLTLFLYALLLGYLIIVPYFTKSLGLRQTWEGWVCTVYIGVIISTFYSSMRVMLSELCPEGDENEWFSLYLLADKGSSWMGPFVTGAIYTWTGDYRKAFWFPAALMAVGVLILSTVNMDKGKDEARNFAAEKKARYESDHGKF